MIIDHIKRTIQLGSVYSIGSISQGALFVLLFPIYTSFLSPQDFGIIGLMSITVSLLSRFVSSPINSAFTRFYYAPEYKEKSGLLLFNLFLWALLIITCCAAIFWRVSEYLAGILLQDRTLAHLLKIYALILFLQPFSSLISVFASYVGAGEILRFYIYIKRVALRRVDSVYAHCFGERGPRSYRRKLVRSDNHGTHDISLFLSKDRHLSCLVR